ncbi:MAG TPA: hypothetical protein VEZ90_10975, partial [Blastocatellia bacterium]|nr:hypothetical protein [Blastocatellia bacterium]
KLLTSVQGGSSRQSTQRMLPEGHPAPAGASSIVDYPEKNQQQASAIALAWPSPPWADMQDWLMEELFVRNLAGGATSSLYRRLVDSKTREVDLGINAVSGYVDDEGGHAITVTFGGIPPANITPESIARVRGIVADEISKIASWKDGSKELAEFNSRVTSLIAERRRDLSKFVDSPPGFGFRNTSDRWLVQLNKLALSPEFKKTVTMGPELERIAKLVESNENIWRGCLEKWKLAGVTPYAVGSHPSPELLKREESEAGQRVQAQIDALGKKYGVTDRQEAIGRYKKEYDSASAELDAESRKAASNHFIDNPPLTLDDSLDFKVSSLPSGVPIATATFDNMTSSTVGIAFKLDGVPDDDLAYMGLLPAFLNSVGAVVDGKAFSYQEITERLRREILSLNVYPSANYRTGRVELVVRGAGNDLSESKRAVEWMGFALLHPNLMPNNLPRIRDLVTQYLVGLRLVTRAPEEYWVQLPALAYQLQDNPLMLSTISLATVEHSAFELSWMLKDASPTDREEVAGFLRDAASAGGGSTRDELKSFLSALQGNGGDKLPASLKPCFDRFGTLNTRPKALAIEASRDLTQILTEVPDQSLHQDWRDVCLEMSRDVQVTPEQTLERIKSLVSLIARRGNARVFVIGSRKNQEDLRASIGGLIDKLAPGGSEPIEHPRVQVIKERLLGRDPEARHPVYVGLVAENLAGGVFTNSAPLAT